MNSSSIARNTSSNWPAIPKPSYNVLLSWFLIGILISIISGLLSVLLAVVIGRSASLRRGSGSIILFTLLINGILNGFIQPIYLIQVSLIQTDRPTSIHCSVYMLLRLTLIGSEYWASLFLALNRLVAIMLPHLYKTLTRRSLLYSVMLISVAVPFAVNVPTLFDRVYQSGRFPPLMACTLKPLSETLIIVNSAVGTYIPIGLLGVVYIVIALYLLLRKVNDAGRKMARRVAVAKMLFISYLVYVVCFVPVVVMVTFYPFILFRNAELMLWLMLVQLLGFAATPVVFLVMNGEYRNCIAGLLGRKRVGPEISASISQTNNRKMLNRGSTKIAYDT